MSLLRADLWLRNQSESPHPPETSGNPCFLPLLPADLHPEQHGPATCRPGAPAPQRPDSVEVRLYPGDAGSDPDRRCRVCRRRSSRSEELSGFTTARCCRGGCRRLRVGQPFRIPRSVRTCLNSEVPGSKPVSGKPESTMKDTNFGHDHE